jgi:hypothetical protein
VEQGPDYSSPYLLTGGPRQSLGWPSLGRLEGEKRESLLILDSTEFKSKSMYLATKIEILFYFH